MRKIIPILILLIPSMVFAASFVDDEFSGDLSAWTQSGNGTIITDGGYLSITSSDLVYDYLTQANITGAFDLVARLKDPYYPSVLPSAYVQNVFYVKIDDDNYLYGLQNRKTGSETQNEFYIARCRNGATELVYNPATDPMSHVCIRISRDESNDFSIYYNTVDDCTGDWVELNQGIYVLNSSEPVAISIRTIAPEASTTYLTDYVRTFGSSPPTSKTLEGGTIQGVSIE